MSAHIYITSKASGARYEIKYIKTYRVEQDVEVPAGSFEFVIGNNNYEVSDVISGGDYLSFYVDGKLTLIGYIDDVEFNYGIDSNDIRITGRDKMSILLDNDALPKTFYKLSLKDYLKKVGNTYNINTYTTSTKKFSKITISPGETEFDVINRLCSDRKLTALWSSGNELQCIHLTSSSTPYYTFSNDLKNAIRIKNANVTISADIKDEIIVYGDIYEKNKKIVGHYKNGKPKYKTTSTKIILNGSYEDKTIHLSKRKIVQDADVENTKDAEERAKNEFYLANRNSFMVDISTQTKLPIYLNKATKVYIKKMDLNVMLLVSKVIYTKDSSSGSLTDITLKLMPGIDVNYKNNSIPLLPKLEA